MAATFFFQHKPPSNYGLEDNLTSTMITTSDEKSGYPEQHTNYLEEKSSDPLIAGPFAGGHGPPGPATNQEDMLDAYDDQPAPAYDTIAGTRE